MFTNSYPTLYQQCGHEITHTSSLNAKHALFKFYYIIFGLLLLILIATTATVVVAVTIAGRLSFKFL